MLDVKTLTKNISINKQIELNDVAKLAKLGFKSIINNRPNCEEIGQANSVDLEKEAKNHNISYKDIPIDLKLLGNQQIYDFTAAIQSMPTPILAFCRSGNRSMILWSMAMAKELDINNILDLADKNGYNLLPVLPKIQAIKDNGQL